MEEVTEDEEIALSASQFALSIIHGRNQDAQSRLDAQDMWNTWKRRAMHTRF